MITEEIRASCAKAHSKYKQSLNDKNDEKEQVLEDLKDKRAVAEKEDAVKLEQMKAKLSKSSKFCAPELLESIYKKKKDEKDPNSNDEPSISSENEPSSSETRKRSASNKPVKHSKKSKKSKK